MGPSLAALLTLVILVDDPSDPMNDAMRAAASEVLGAATEVRIAAASTRANVASVAPSGDEVAEVLVRWSPDRTTAIVGGRDPSLGLAERQVTFSQDDDPLERGRTLGYMIAALLPAQRAALPPSVEPAAVATQAPAPARPTEIANVAPALQVAVGFSESVRQ